MLLIIDHVEKDYSYKGVSTENQIARIHATTEGIDETKGYK